MNREELAKAFADRLNMIKNDTDITYRDIERATGIPHTSIGIWTHGKTLPNTYSLISTGQDNGLILENLRKLSARGARIWIRVPVIPGFNDSLAEMEAIGAIVNDLSGVEKVTLMPYHTLGRSKYETLGLVPPYDTTRSISSKELNAFKTCFYKAED